MNIDRDQILQLLHSQGDSDKAERAQNVLPGHIDTDDPDHRTLLQQFGLDPTELLGKLGGKTSGGGALGKLL